MGQFKPQFIFIYFQTHCARPLKKHTKKKRKEMEINKPELTNAKHDKEKL